MKGPGNAFERAESAVLIRCRPHLLAVAAFRVERLLLAEELSETPAGPGEVPLVWSGGRPWASWNLGRVLELEPQVAAWVLLRAAWRGADLQMALRTGPCVAVRQVRDAAPLPSRVLRARRGAFPRAFAVEAALGKPDEALLGYLLEPDALWTEAELEASAQALSRAQAHGPGAAPRDGRAAHGSG